MIRILLLSSVVAVALLFGPVAGLVAYVAVSGVATTYAIAEDVVDARRNIWRARGRR